MVRAGRVFKSAARKNLSATDYEEWELADIDHPYAQRHGAIQVNYSGGSGFLAHPEVRVHSRTGQLRSALRGETRSRGPVSSYALRLDTSIAPHAVFVVSGTNVMLPRDVLEDTAAAPRLQRDVLRVIKAELKPALFGTVKAASFAEPEDDGSDTGLGGAL